MLVVLIAWGEWGEPTNERSGLKMLPLVVMMDVTTPLRKTHVAQLNEVEGWGGGGLSGEGDEGFRRSAGGEMMVSHLKRGGSASRMFFSLVKRDDHSLMEAGPQFIELFFQNFVSCGTGNGGGWSKRVTMGCGGEGRGGEGKGESVVIHRSQGRALRRIIVCEGRQGRTVKGI